jgi:hypothetical protein
MSLMQRIQRKARRELLTRTAGGQGAAKGGDHRLRPDRARPSVRVQRVGVATVVAVSDVRAGAMALLCGTFRRSARSATIGR